MKKGLLLGLILAFLLTVLVGCDSQNSPDGTEAQPDTNFSKFDLNTGYDSADVTTITLAQGKSTTYEEVLEDQRKRDYADATRATAPLKPAPDAVLFDTTALDIPGATAAALAIIAEKQKVLSV